MALTATANTVFHALLGDAVTFPVDGVSGGNAQWVTSGTTVVDGTWNTKARRFNGTTDYIKCYDAATPTDPYDGFSQALYDAFRGEFTCFILFKPANPIAVNGQMFSYGMSSTSIFRALLNSASPADVVESHTRSSGLTQLVSIACDVILHERPYIWTLTMSGGVYKAFLNGALYYESSILFTPTTAGGDTARWATTIGAGGVSAVSARYAGDIEEIFVENRCWTEDEVRDVSLGLAAAASADETAPVISNVTPTAGGSIGRHEAWSGRVTDGVGFRRIILTVTYPSGLSEVAWNGTEFTGPYTANSSRTEVSAGLVYRFSILRAGGWPADPTVDVYAIDTSGNEGT